MSVTRKGLKLPQRLKSVMTVGSVKAGVLSGATYSANTYIDAKTGQTVHDNRAGMHVATIAAALEYGEGQNHPRPYNQQAVVKHGKEWSGALTALLKQGKSANEALLTVGLVMKEDLQEEIRSWPADNAKAWAETKGFNHGLIQTGHLMNSIESQLETDD